MRLGDVFPLGFCWGGGGMVKGGYYPIYVFFLFGVGGRILGLGVWGGGYLGLGFVLVWGEGCLDWFWALALGRCLFVGTRQVCLAKVVEVGVVV